MYGFYRHKNVFYISDSFQKIEQFELLINEAAPNVEIYCFKNYDEMEIHFEKKSQPDIIFVDMKRPAIDTVGIISKVRACKKLDGIPLAVYSECLSEKDLNETYQTGANLYVFKAVDKSSAQTMINKVLSLDWSYHQPFPEKIKFFVNHSSLKSLTYFVNSPACNIADVIMSHAENEVAEVTRLYAHANQSIKYSKASIKKSTYVIEKCNYIFSKYRTQLAC